jgi:hypothetical protein
VKVIRVWEITYTHKDCSEKAMGGHRVSLTAEGPIEAIRKFKSKKGPFFAIIKLEAFPKTEALLE